MIETKEEYVPEYFPASCSVTMHREIIVSEDDKDLGRLRVHSMAFVPGEVDKLVEHIGDDKAPIVAYCNAIWTPDVIAKQEAINAANQQIEEVQ